MASNTVDGISSRPSAATLEALLVEKQNIILGLDPPELAPGSSVYSDEVPDYYAAGGLLACLIPIFVPALDGHAGPSRVADTRPAPPAPPAKVCSTHFPWNCPSEAPCGQAAAKLVQLKALGIKPMRDLGSWTQNYACEAQNQFLMEQKSRRLFEEEVAAEEAAQEEVWQAILVEMENLNKRGKRKTKRTWTTSPRFSPTSASRQASSCWTH